MLRFTKMNGAGNDFVVIDNRQELLHLSAQQISLLCDRHRGVGADGVLVVEPSSGKAEFHNKGVKLYLSDPKEMLLNRALEIEKRKISIHSINTGVPHVVTFVDDLETTPVRDWGAKIRYHTAFSPKGTNANFVKQLEPGRIAVRTYERGVEDETLACGTGVTASGLIYALLNGSEAPVSVLARGGDWLEVGFRKTLSGFEEVTLEGPGDFVFEGTINIS